jgi:hypothetical protein
LHEVKRATAVDMIRYGYPFHLWGSTGSLTSRYALQIGFIGGIV